MEDFQRDLKEITFEATDGELAATNRETPWRLKWRKILGLKCHQNLGCIASAKWNVALNYNLVTPDLVCDRFLIALSAFPSPTISSVHQFEKVGLEINQLSSSVACDERDDVSRFFEDFDPEKHRTKLNGIRNFLWKLRNLFFSAEIEQRRWRTIQSTSSVTNWKDSRKPFVLINQKLSRSWWECRWAKSRCMSPAICKWSTSRIDSKGQLRHESSAERQSPTTRKSQLNSLSRLNIRVRFVESMSMIPRELNYAMHE